MSERPLTREEMAEIDYRGLEDAVHSAWYREARRLLAEARKADKPFAASSFGGMLGRKVSVRVHPGDRVIKTLVCPHKEDDDDK